MDLVNMTPLVRLWDTENFIHTKHGYCYYDTGSKPHPFVWGLFVEPQYRGKGHARRLLQYVIDAIRANGYTGEIAIEAAPKEHNIDAERLVLFYVGMGLKVLGRKAGEE